MIVSMVMILFIFFVSTCNINDIPVCNYDKNFSLLFADDLVSLFSFRNTGKIDGIEDKMEACFLSQKKIVF